jgi:hypothetical protein
VEGRVAYTTRACCYRYNLAGRANSAGLERVL